MRWAFALLILAPAAWQTPAAPLPEAASKDQELAARLIALLDDGDAEVRQNIAIAVANLGDTAVPALINALEHSRPERRMGAALALAYIQPAPRSAVPALVRVMNDKDVQVRRDASYALSRIVGRDVPASIERPLNVPPPEPTPSIRGTKP